MKKTINYNRNTLTILRSYALTVFLVFSLSLPTTLKAQEMQLIKIYKDGNILYSSTLSATDTLTFVKKEGGVFVGGHYWATCNVDMPGTFAANPEDAGMFYQWSRNVGWSSTDPLISSNGETTWDSSWSQDYYWKSENDPCPTGWRVPLNHELKSLGTGSWGELNGVPGRFFGDEEQKLFFPAAGYRTFGALGGVGERGEYWSGRYYDSFNACYMYITKFNVGIGYQYTQNGISVRCVSE